MAKLVLLAYNSS